MSYYTECTLLTRINTERRPPQTRICTSLYVNAGASRRKKLPCTLTLGAVARALAQLVAATRPEVRDHLDAKRCQLLHSAGYETEKHTVQYHSGSAPTVISCHLHEMRLPEYSTLKAVSLCKHFSDLLQRHHHFCGLVRRKSSLPWSNA